MKEEDEKLDLFGLCFKINVPQIEIKAKRIWGRTKRFRLLIYEISHSLL